MSILGFSRYSVHLIFISLKHIDAVPLPSCQMYSYIAMVYSFLAPLARTKFPKLMTRSKIVPGLRAAAHGMCVKKIL